MKRVLLIDDMRTNTDPGCEEATVIARNYLEGLKLLLNFDDWDVLLIDHDLGDFGEEGNERTGYDVMCKLEEAVFLYGHFAPPIIKCVSSNGPGRKRIQQVIDKLARGY